MSHCYHSPRNLQGIAAKQKFAAFLEGVFRMFFGFVHRSIMDQRAVSYTLPRTWADGELADLFREGLSKCVFLPVRLSSLHHDEAYRHTIDTAVHIYAIGANASLSGTPELASDSTSNSCVQVRIPEHNERRIAS